MRSFVPFFAGLALCACAGTPPPVSGGGLTVVEMDGLPAPAVDASGLPLRPVKIDAGDLLTIEMVGIDEEPRDVVVDPTGSIALPIAGRVTAAGRSPDDLARSVTELMRAGHVRYPEVVINVKESRSRVVTVDGEVREPGVYPLGVRASLMRAVATAKGLSEFAKLDDVVLLRTINGERYAALYNLGAIRRGAYADPPVYADDVIIVGDSPSRRIFKNLIAVSPVLAAPIIAILQKN